MGERMIVCGIDPGPEQSAAVWWDGERAIDPTCEDNVNLRERCWESGCGQYAIEWVHCYGREIGQSVFGTAFWVGRFAELSFTCPLSEEFDAVTRGFTLVTRREVCEALIGDRQAKKRQVNAYLLDTYGPKGTKKEPGPLYGVQKHIWDALAVAVVAHRRLTDELDERQMNPSVVRVNPRRQEAHA